VSGETLPAEIRGAFVFLSARDPATGAFVTRNQAPEWQKAVALVPLIQGDGSVSLCKFTFSTLPSDPSAVVPDLLFTTGQATLRWLDASTLQVVSSEARPRAAYLSVSLPNLTAFDCGVVSSVPSGGQTAIPTNIWRINAQVAAAGPKGPMTVAATTSIRGRN
jgi:hypothetical protein